jgi:hypothetical protein
MPLVPVNLDRDALADPQGTARALAAALERLAAGAPVIALIHGYKFSPRTAFSDPHSHILGLEPRSSWKAVSWPRRLGVGKGDGPGDGPGETTAEPLCLALGWEARGTLWQAYAEAERAGRGLARLVELLQRLRPGLSVDVLAHSFGGRVALSALPHLEAGALGRAVLLAPAELRSRALAARDTPAGRRLEVLQVGSAENLPYDRALAWLIAPHRPAERALGLGLGLGRPDPRWTHLRIDEPGVRAALDGLGYPVPAPDRRICHWSVYLRAGLFPLYRAVLDGSLPLARLAAALPPAPCPATPRPLRLPSLPLPGARLNRS